MRVGSPMVVVGAAVLWSAAEAAMRLAPPAPVPRVITNITLRVAESQEIPRLSYIQSRCGMPPQARMTSRRVGVPEQGTDPGRRWTAKNDPCHAATNRDRVCRARAASAASSQWRRGPGASAAARSEGSMALLPEQVDAILVKSDPVNLICRGAPSDEYRGEARRIAARVTPAMTLDEVLDVVHRVFTECFGPESAGPRDAYVDIAVAIRRLPGEH